MNQTKKRRTLTRLSLGCVLALGLFSILVIGLLIRITPLSMSPPQITPRQPLGEGEAMAFSYMRMDMLRPFQLYILEGDSAVRSLSQGLMRSDLGPVWSPDGNQLIYESVSGVVNQYHLVNADGTNHRKITLEDAYNGYKSLLRWSPDGSRLAYVSYTRQPDGNLSSFIHLCVTEVNSMNTQRTATGNIQDLGWRPDGQTLLAVERVEEGITLETYDLNGAHTGRISAANYLEGASAITISPDTSKVAYIELGRDDDPGSMSDQLHISALDGSETTRVGVIWGESSLVWSPDGERIAFVAFTKDFENALYVITIDGMVMQELGLINTGDENGEIIPADPAWSPDGRRIAISSLSSPEGPAILVMNADGSNRQEIITLAGAGGMIYDLAWKP